MNKITIQFFRFPFFSVLPDNLPGSLKCVLRESKQNKPPQAHTELQLTGKWHKLEKTGRKLERDIYRR